MKFSLYEKDVKYKMNEYNVVNGISKFRKSLFFTLCLIFWTFKFYSQNLTSWELWEKGRIEDAHNKVGDYPLTNSRKHLLGNIYQVKGDYDNALKVYSKIPNSYKKINDVYNSIVTIKLFHEKVIDSRRLDFPMNKMLKTYSKGIDKKMKVISKGSFKVKMDVNHNLNSYIPIINSKINELNAKVAFDTGANFVIMSKKNAEKFNIKFDQRHYFNGQQGFGESKMYVGIIESFTLGENLRLINVPVTILEQINTDIIIFGTNIIKEFLTTINYPENYFLFTTLDQDQKLIEQKERFAGNNMNFYMWGDHYLMGQGELSGEKISMFFDTGLVVVDQIKEDIIQSWFCLTNKTLNNFGITDKINSTNKIIETNLNLTFAGIDHKNSYLSICNKEFNFGGINNEILISHGVLKNYIWTIDFERMNFTFK